MNTWKRNDDTVDPMVWKHGNQVGPMLATSDEADALCDKIQDELGGRCDWRVVGGRHFVLHVSQEAVDMLERIE